MTIRASDNGRFLVDEGGDPFFWLGDTAWQIFHRLDRDDAERYLADRAAKGFTVIQAVATGKLADGWLTAPNRAGDTPFRGRKPLRPNPLYFDHVDWVIECAARHGIRVALLPSWREAVAGAADERILDPLNARGYGAWLGQRYRDSGIIWVLGGDVNPVTLDPAPSTYRATTSIVTDLRPVYDALADGILEGGGRDAFITYHPTVGSPSAAAPPRMSRYFGDRSWHAMNMIQSGQFLLPEVDRDGGAFVSRYSWMWSADYNYLAVGDEYRSHPTRPVIDSESRYEGHPALDAELRTVETWTAFDSRNSAYHGVFAGAAGHTYGHGSVWDFYTAADRHEVIGFFAGILGDRIEWQAALDAPGARQMRHLKALMLSRPYLSRVPDDGIVLGDLGRGRARISGTRDSEGSYAMAYLPHGGDVEMNLSTVGGARRTAWWFDPRTGDVRRADQLEDGATTVRLRPPTSGAEEDWILVVDDASCGFPPPGASAP